MLESIRKSKNNLFFLILILLIVGIMALYGIGQMGSQAGGGGVAAWVNGEVITRVDFQRELERRRQQYEALFGQALDENFLRDPRVLEGALTGLVQAKLLSQQASKMGFTVTDFELSKFIRSVPSFQKGGKFDAKLYQSIPNRGMMEESQREQMRVSKLQDYLAGRIRLTPNEIKKFHALNETKINLSFAKIDFESIASRHTVTKAETEHVLKNTPESEFEAYYKNHQADFLEKAASRVRQIRVGVPFQATAEIAKKAAVKMDDIKKQVDANNFSQMAKKLSDDEYAQKGGDLGWVEPGALDPKLDTQIAALQVGQISPVIEAPGGLYLLFLEDRKEDKTQLLESVKPIIAEKLAKQKYQQELEQAKKTEWDAELAKGKSIEPALKELKIDVKDTGLFAIGQDYIPMLGQVDRVLDAAFALTMEKPIPSALISHLGSYYFIKLKEVQTPKDAALAASKLSETESQMASSIEGMILRKWIEDLEKSATIKKEI